mgnify:CR=1 FL=1
MVTGDGRWKGKKKKLNERKEKVNHRKRGKRWITMGKVVSMSKRSERRRKWQRITYILQ